MHMSAIKEITAQGFYLFSLTGNITKSSFTVIFKIIEVISLNFAELYCQLFFPLDLFTFRGGNPNAVLLNITSQACDIVLFTNYWLLGLMKQSRHLLKHFVINFLPRRKSFEKYKVPKSG